MKSNHQSLLRAVFFISFCCCCCCFMASATSKRSSSRQLLARQLGNLDLNSLLALLSPKSSSTTTKPSSLSDILSPDGLTAVIECEINGGQGLCVPTNMTHFVCAPLGFMTAPYNRTCGNESVCCYMTDDSTDIDVTPPSAEESKASLSKFRTVKVILCSSSTLRRANKFSVCR